jgi:integrase
LKLNQKIVNAIAPGEGLPISWDDSCPGFGVRPSKGAVSYVVSYRIGQEKRLRVIGSTGSWGYSQARDRAREILIAAKENRDLTVDPRTGMLTFGDVWRQMIDEVDKPKLSPATIADYEDRARRLILPRIGKKLVGDVTPADVDKIVAATPGERNRAYAIVLIKKTINHAKRAHILPDNHRNPAVGITMKRPAKKGRALDTDEIAAFGKALADMEGEGKISPWIANLLRLSLICGLRPGEVRTLKWSAVNLPRNKMVVTGKTGAREIYLTDAAIGVLTATPRIQGNEFVFAGRIHGQPIAAVHKVLKAVQARAGVERFRPYDLRHSAATGALAPGVDVRAVQALLGHSDLRTTSGYLHSSDKRRVAAAKAASAFGRGVLK